MPNAQPARRRGTVVSATAGVPVVADASESLKTSIMDFYNNDVITDENVERVLEEFPPLDSKVAMKTMREFRDEDIGAEEVLNRILAGRTDHQAILDWIQLQHGPKQLVVVLNLYGDDAVVPEDERDEYPTLESFWKRVVEDNIGFEHVDSGVTSITVQPLTGR